MTMVIVPTGAPLGPTITVPRVGHGRASHLSPGGDIDYLLRLLTGPAAPTDFPAYGMEAMGWAPTAGPGSSADGTAPHRRLG